MIYKGFFAFVVHFGIYGACRDKLATERYYQNAEKYDLPTIEEAIQKLASENKVKDKGGEVVVPRRIIKIFDKKYQSGKPMAYLCGIYIDEYLR